jgi:hypothetical protein
MRWLPRFKTFSDCGAATTRRPGTRRRGWLWRSQAVEAVASSPSEFARQLYADPEFNFMSLEPARRRMIVGALLKAKAEKARGKDGPSGEKQPGNLLPPGGTDEDRCSHGREGCCCVACFAAGAPVRGCCSPSASTKRSVPPSAPPNCPCHQTPMCWNRDGRKAAGGFWRCRVKKRASDRAGYARNPEKKRQAVREYYHDGPGYVLKRRRELAAQRRVVLDKLAALDQEATLA